MTPEPSRRAVPRALQVAVLGWFDANGRALAFRTTRDPYAVLVSEIMAQQTQVARAASAWEAWMRRFPTVTALADAPVADVIRQWAGLGYNRRAVNLHRAASAIVDRHGGRVPSSLTELAALPGVGPYTARAVAAIAFGAPVGAVDVNVRRVLGRVLAGSPDAVPAAELQSAADQAVPRGRPGDWTHALMDIGARLCRPREPRCDACPVAAWCVRRQRGDATPPPVRVPGTATRFPSTSRWLRGQLLDRVRGSAAWAVFDAPVGTHDLAAVAAALRALERDGLVELRADGPHLRAKLPG